MFEAIFLVCCAGADVRELEAVPVVVEEPAGVARVLLAGGVCGCVLTWEAGSVLAWEAGSVLAWEAGWVLAWEAGWVLA